MSIDFDDLISETPATPASTPPTAVADGGRPSVGSQTDNDTPESEFPRIIENVPYGETPPDHMTVAEFAMHVSAIGIERAMTSTDTNPNPLNLRDALSAFTVKDQSVYQAINAKRDPLPSSIVQNHVTTADGETELQTKAYLPIDEATLAWFQRKDRPRGLSSATTPEAIEARVLRAGKARAKKLKLELRLIKVSEELEKVSTLVDKYTVLLPQVNKSWDDAVTAHDAWSLSLEAGKEIPDDEDTDTNGTDSDTDSDTDS